MARLIRQTKECKRCGAVKAPAEFHRAAQRKDGTWIRQTICKSCATIKAREYYQANQERLQEHNRLKARRYREENPEYYRWEHIRRKYGLSPQDWDRLYDLQLGRCAICLLPLVETKKIHVDHNHTTGKIRGLLCNYCNSILGYAREDVEILNRAVQYLLSQVGEEVMPDGDSVPKSQL